MKRLRLDKEELPLEKQIENGEWMIVPNLAEEIKKYQKYAHNTFKKIATL